VPSPIVFRSAGDPILVGLVASLARPGGNVTGFSQAGPEVTGKRLSLLKELLPGLQRIGVLWEADNPYNPYNLPTIAQPADSSSGSANRSALRQFSWTMLHRVRLAVPSHN
jgi:ABC-type uncharacterized transport system substrate-binding protein